MHRRSYYLRGETLMTEALDGFIVARRDGSLHCVAVDREDYAAVEAGRPWHVWPRRQTFYARRDVLLPDGRRTTEWLHRFILGRKPGDGLETDHIDGNGLNNTRANLRVVRHAENCQNIRRVGGSSKYRGVSWSRSCKKWKASVEMGGRQYYFGYFTDEVAAARAARDARARLFTHTNEQRHTIAGAEAS